MGLFGHYDDDFGKHTVDYYQLRDVLEIAKIPKIIRFEGEDVESCPKCGNFSIRLMKHCCDCGQILKHEYETHEDYEGV